MIEAATIADVRRAVAGWRRAGETVGLVPTMGFLHEGHLSLVRLARERAQRVVVSIFVNPLQFGRDEDLDRYPRDLERDRRLLAGERIDLLFAPTVAEMYPASGRTTVDVASVSEGLCGAARPGHFRGVATVVAKLFGIVAPDLAVFGRKDAQQLAVIRTMVRDLDMAVEIVGGEIVREADGLARSSRNTYLSADERRNALALSRALFEVRDGVADGALDLPSARARLHELLEPAPGVALEYAELADPETMEIVHEDRSGPTLALVAARVGATRLIDNVELHGTGLRE